MVIYKCSVQLTCFKGSFESLVNSGRVTIAFELHPNNVPFTLYGARLCAATQMLGQDRTTVSLDIRRIVDFNGGFTELNIVVFAVLAVLQFKYFEVNLDLPSFRDN